MKKEEAIIKLKRDLEIRRYSLGTIHRYSYVVERFLDYIGNKKEIDDLNEYDAIEYLQVLTNERHYKSSSYNNINAILKFFLETTLEKNVGYKRMPNAKLEVRIKMVPDKKTILYIINKTENLKHKCWYCLAYGSGLRTCEISKLKMKDIDSKNMKVTVVGKGNKERITVLPIITLNYLKEYVITNNIRNRESYLFEGQGIPYISESTILRSFRDIVKKLGLDNRITIHSLRRSFATHLLRNGTDIQIVKELMGHNSITTTMGYAQVVYKEKEIKNPLDGESNEL